MGDRLYVHVSALNEELQLVAAAAAVIAGIEEAEFNVVRFSKSADKLSLLDYPTLLSDGFPALRASWAVDLDTEVVEARKYASSTAPILHRKELLLPVNHPSIREFEALTARAESLGLFEDSRIIGMRITWEEELRAKGVRVIGNRLVPAPEGDASAPPQVLRHRTALSRNRLSSPMMALWRHGFLDGTHSVFDYGCGRGDDLLHLISRGVEATGWDPHFRPEDLRSSAAVVNLGFVLNVIEEPAERSGALTGAFALTTTVLSVAALIGGRTAYERHRLYRDGVLTSRSTFQKYFSHVELGEYIAEVLGREPVSIAPGLYFVFRSDEAEQDFLERRQRSPRAVKARSPVPKRKAGARVPTRRSTRTTRWDEQRRGIDELWAQCLDLGRFPVEEEYPELRTLRKKLGTEKWIFAELLRRNGAADLDAAQEHRRRDLSVYLALSLFDRRRSFTALSERLQRDVRALWGSYKAAIEDARRLLFQIADSEAVGRACAEAAEKELGHLVPERRLQFESSLLSRMPPLLRVYAGCAGKLIGEAEEADLIRIHIDRGAVTFMLCDDFSGQPIPSLIEKIRVDLRTLRVRVTDYGESNPPRPVLLKSLYMDKSSLAYEEQKGFDSQVMQAGIVPGSTDRLTWLEFGRVLEEVGLELDGVHQSGRSDCV